MRTAAGLLLCLAAAVGLARLSTAETKARAVKSFRLTDSAGKGWSLADQKGKKAVVVVFLGTECPVNNQYLPRLAEMSKDYAEKGVAFVGVNSNVQDTATRVAAHVKANEIPFPVLKDVGNVVADDFAARRTPEAFVLSPEGKILYQGRIDDQYGVGFKRKAPTRRDLASAIDEALAGKAVSVAKTDAPGCLIARTITPKESGSITFTKHISRILQNRCQECHRAGEVGPMPLLSYEDALSWQGMIDEVVSENRMPPWGADPKHGEFANDRRLTKEEKETLLGWVKQGCPKGDEKDMPAPKTFVSGWSIGKPDVVIEMDKEFSIPADGGARGVRYHYSRVPTNFPEDMWIQAAECKPQAREVVHHIIVYVVDPAKMRKGDGPGMGADGIGNGFLAAWAPGDMPLNLPADHAKKLPKGAMLVFQMHYTPDGIARKDRSSVGLVFAKKPPKYEVKTRGIAQQFLLRIPAGAPNHEVKSRTTFKQDVMLMSYLPHMHLRGKDFKYDVTYPDGRTETLMSVPKYEFNWQGNYRLKTPLKLPAGTRIDCTAHFDNSAGNFNNPDPTKVVYWGDQTWEEMMIGFVDYAYLREGAAK